MEADSGESPEELARLRKERSLLLGELGTLRAKFELTLQTLRSILGLELNCSWADIVEHVELLGRLADGHKGQDKSFKEEEGDDEESEAEELRQLLLQAEMDLDEKEQQLEEQCARVRDLSDVLSKQQNVLDMTCAQLSNQNEQKDLVSKQREELLRTTADRDRLNDERNRLREETRKLRDLNVFQQKHLQEKESQLAVAEASLVEKHTCLARREQELGDLQADHERQRAEIEELCDVVASRDDEVGRIRSQLEVYEAAERRKHSYRPGPCDGSFVGRLASSRSGPLEDTGSGPPSSASSAYPSARGSAPRYNDSVPSTPGAQSPVTSSSLRRPMRPVLSMDRDERAAFLSHFPMASRTERLMRTDRKSVV